MADPRPVSFGDLRRVTPLEPNFGFGRGLPVDRIYIERFLDRNRLAIRGRVLEVGDRTYTTRFGDSAVESSDVLSLHPQPGTTTVADLASAGQIPDEQFDCIICTQTLQYVLDLPPAVETLHRLLRPGGTLLLTVPGISRTDDAAWADRWCWGFTPASVGGLLKRAFEPDLVEVTGHGNVLVCVAFLHGLVAADLSRSEIDHQDPGFPLVITAVATKRSESATAGADVAIVIPCFDQAHFLEDAIESALAQSCPAREIVVIDDGSSDNTSQVATRYPDVQYCYQPNGGLSAARNAGIRHTSSNVLLFLDADDRLLPHAIERGLREFARHPECAYVSGHYRLIGVDGRVLDQWERELIEGDRYERLLRGNYVAMGAAVLHRRRALESVGGFDVTLDAAEDYDVFLSLARRFPVCDHDTVVAEYRRHGEGMTDDPARLLRALLKVLERHDAAARERPAYAAAIEEGRRVWHRDFGSKRSRQEQR